jgi:penicillin amidase
MRKTLKRVAIGIGLALTLVLIFGAGGFLWVRSRVLASLPQLDGRLEIAGLRAEVRVERDELGIPTVRAASRHDLALATGFLHAQDRFFQMDLLRRQAAGELAELFGRAAVEADRDRRLHRFRSVARRNLELTDVLGRELLDAYSHGVNAGLATLGDVPPEYLALRLDPAPWLPEDSNLVLLAMYLDLQGGEGLRESALGLMYDLLPAALVDFLVPAGTEWDAPIVGPVAEAPPIPGPALFDLRDAASEASSLFARVPVAGLAGSNNWAVAGDHTEHGGALLANDLHLGLGLPNIWYRARFVLDDPAGGEERRIDGATLPGAPAMVVGSNGHVAWGFTNTHGDWSDLVVLEPDPDDADGRYLTPDGPQPFERHEETIRVKGKQDERVTVVSTIWGPVIDEDHRGRRRALRWVAHDTFAADLSLLALESAGNVEQAFEVANRSRIPAQNLVVADRTGRIGWSVMGPIPRRVGFDGRLPVSWADGRRRWDGWLDPDEYPRVVDPPSGRVWTANNRVGDARMTRTIGDDGFALGARARQIRDGLFALERASEEQLLAIQLDDRALFLERWRELLLEVLSPETQSDPRRRELRRWVETDWSGRASVESVGYRMVRGYRFFLARQLFDAITSVCKERDERFDLLRFPQYEAPLWRLVTERPAHFLDPRFDSWEEQLLVAVDTMLDYFHENDASSLEQRTWGQRNTVEIKHPFSLAAPQLSGWLDIPPQPLPGDANMPRVQSPRFGASERMVVSPGREERGIFHMPGGQSGHPLSPWYRMGHEAWVSGSPTRLLPGPAVHSLTLVPPGS